MWTRDGRFVVKRKTQGKRLAKKLQALRIEARRQMHAPMSDQQVWLSQVLRGHYVYYGLPSNYRAMQLFYYHVRWLWFRVLHRRSQRGMKWKSIDDLLTHFPLPRPTITHPLESCTV